MAGRPTPAEPFPGGYPPGAEPFLAAVVSNPDDDTARLVFADWLQESGDAGRAEFIRLQIDLHARRPDYDTPPGLAALAPDDCERFERQRDLLAGHRTAWLAGYPRWAVSWLWQSFRRGFPTTAHCSPGQWTQDGERLRRWLPLEEVSIQGGAAEYPEVFDLPSLVGLKRLILGRVGTAELRALAASAVPASLEALRLNGRQPIYGRHAPPEVPALRALFGSAELSNLRELHARFDRSGDTLGFVVGGSPHLRNLRALSLSEGMRDAAARDLFDSPNLANLTRLALPENAFGDLGVRGLVRSKHATALADLDLRDTGLTAEAGRLLAAWPGLRGVRCLRLNGNGLGVAGVTVLSESPFLENLRVLQLNGNVGLLEGYDLRRLPGFAHVQVTA